MDPCSPAHILCHERLERSVTCAKNGAGEGERAVCDECEKVQKPAQVGEAKALGFPDTQGPAVEAHMWWLKQKAQGRVTASYQAAPYLRLF